MALKLEPIHSHGEPDLDGDMEIKHDDDAHVDPFNMVYSWTLDIPVSLAARGLFVYLMDWAGNKKKTWHRRKRMAAAVGVSPRTLHKYLHELEDQGLIWFEHRKAEGKPSMCHISGKARVVQRQQILSLSANKDPMQILQEVAPLAKSARPPRKNCKTPSQNLQQNKDIRSNHTNKTDEPGVGADKPRRPAKPTLAQRDPHLAERRDHIADYYESLTGHQRRACTLKDAETLAKMTDADGVHYHIDSICGAIAALWYETNASGKETRFHRKSYYLGKVPDSVAAFERDELSYRFPDPEPEPTPAAEPPRRFHRCDVCKGFSGHKHAMACPHNDGQVIP